jgi:hypothetical protein
MGIRFYCPNGHKLNVKENLAGKRGLCPHCGVKLLIPQKSTRPSSQEEREQQQRLAANAGGNPNDFDVFIDDQGTAEVAISFSESSNAANATTASVGSSALAATFDDPSVVWYVQLADGQRFGPATLAIMRTWVNERRIGPDMLVWREGWQDWIEARRVFPEIEKILAEWQAKKSRNKQKPPVTKSEYDRGIDEKRGNGTLFLLLIAVMIAVAIFGIVLYFLLKP